MHVRKELDYLVSALTFYTRIPCPGWKAYSDENLNKSRKYFPLIGWVVGAIAVFVYLLAQLVLPASVAIVLSMAATVYATGAFHEDGFADSCDGFGGGWDKDQVLTIMKDSRIGTYGVLALILLVTIKFMALWELLQLSQTMMLVTLFNAHVTSRFLASTVVQSHDYVRDIDRSKIKPIATRRLSRGEMLFSSVFVVVPLCLYSPMWLPVLAVIPVVGVRVYLASYFKHRIGGYTGDCLGAVQQGCEVVFYLSVLSLCASI